MVHDADKEMGEHFRRHGDLDKDWSPHTCWSTLSTTEAGHCTVQFDRCKFCQLKTANCYDFLSQKATPTRILHWDTPDILISQLLNANMKLHVSFWIRKICPCDPQDANMKLHVSFWIKKICHSDSKDISEHSYGVLDQGPKTPLHRQRIFDLNAFTA